MLMANMAVAKKISKDFPDISMLRRHPPPKVSVLEDMVIFYCFKKRIIFLFN